MPKPKRKHTYNPRLIKSHRAYSLEEVAEVYNKHVGTVQRWHREGMKVLDDHKRPILVMGYDVRTFLSGHVAKRRHPLAPGEFFCPRCRLARRPKPGTLTATDAGRRMGREARQVYVYGVCEACGQKMIAFTSDKKIGFQFPDLAAKATEQAGSIIGGESPSVNVDLVREAVLEVDDKQEV